MASSSPHAVKAPLPNNDAQLFAILDSVMRVTLAGFGGALCGLALSRRGSSVVASASALSSSTTKAAAAKVPGVTSKYSAARRDGNIIPNVKKHVVHRHHPIRSVTPSPKIFVDRELPSAWAMACMGFAGIIEFSRVVSPTSIVLEAANVYGGDDDSSEQSTVGIDGEDATTASESTQTPTDGIIPMSISSIMTALSFGEGVLDSTISTSLRTISDYMIGGAIAGALFRGSAVRTKAGARIDASIMGMPAGASNLSNLRGRPLSGIVPGAGLGLLAGAAIVAIEFAQDAVVEHFDQHTGEEKLDDLYNGDANAMLVMDTKEEIPADIKAMSNEELMKSIEELKKNRQ